MSSFRASHNDISIGNIYAFTKKSHNCDSESQRSAPAPTRAADTRPPSSNVAAAQQMTHRAPDFLDSELIMRPSTEPILLPFTARLGERPSSGFQRETSILTSKFKKNEPSVVVGKNSRVHTALDHRQQPSSKKLHGSAAGDVVLSRPHSAAEVPKSRHAFRAPQTSRTRQLGSPSPVKAPPAVTSVTAPNVLPSRGSKRIEMPDRSQVVGSASKNEAPELQGAELEVLLKKQLELVSLA
jgi:hypothetical protein